MIVQNTTLCNEVKIWSNLKSKSESTKEFCHRYFFSVTGNILHDILAGERGQFQWRMTSCFKHLDYADDTWLLFH